MQIQNQHCSVFAKRPSQNFFGGVKFFSPVISHERSLPLPHTFTHLLCSTTSYLLLLHQTTQDYANPKRVLFWICPMHSQSFSIHRQFFPTGGQWLNDLAPATLPLAFGMLLPSVPTHVLTLRPRPPDPPPLLPHRVPIWKSYYRIHRSIFDNVKVEAIYHLAEKSWSSKPDRNLNHYSCWYSFTFTFLKYSR